MMIKFIFALPGTNQKAACVVLHFSHISSGDWLATGPYFPRAQVVQVNIFLDAWESLQLKECLLHHPKETSGDLAKYKGLQVDLTSCTTLKGLVRPVVLFPFFTCPNIQVLEWWPGAHESTTEEAVLKPLHDFILNSSCLQLLEIHISNWSGQLPASVCLLRCMGAGSMAGYQECGSEGWAWWWVWQGGWWISPF